MSSQASTPSAPVNNSATLKRKVRKGTKSCWECKRRKVRCIITFPSTTCDGCKRRNTTCITQEFPDSPVGPPGTNDDLQKRLQLLESTIALLHERLETMESEKSNAEPTALVSPESDPGPTQLAIMSNEKVVEFPTRYSLALSNMQFPGAAVVDAQDDVKSLFADSDFTCYSGCDTQRHHAQIYCMLSKAWPSPHDLDAILAQPHSIFGIFHGTMCAPSMSEVYQQLPSVRSILQLPPCGSHPVLLARKLLILASFLQGLSTECKSVLLGIGVHSDAIMSTVFDAAHKHVTSDDGLLESVDGIECLLIEGLYQNNAGNVRMAWHLVQRAMLIAQLMGLHQDSPPKTLKFLDEDTKMRVQPRYVWLRLTQASRYLSLMLGLLQGTSTNNFASPDMLKNCSPVERMQRMDCAAAGYLLQRNEAGLYETSTKEMIEQMLKQSTSSLNPSWWQSPDLTTLKDNDLSTMDALIRMMDQLAHYNLVLQLHLPHLLHLGPDCEHARSRREAVKASRKILTRFNDMQASLTFCSFCGGVNILAFAACTTLCIAHIDADQTLSFSVKDPMYSPGTDVDDGFKEDFSMMQTALQGMLNLAQNSKHAIAIRTAVALDQLLSVTSIGTIRHNYVIVRSPGSCEPGLGWGGRLCKADQAFYVHIPHFGKIKFMRSTGLERTAAMSRPTVTQSSSTNTILEEKLDLPLPDLLAERTGTEFDRYITGSWFPYSKHFQR